MVDHGDDHSERRFVTNPDPEVVRWIAYEPWPENEPFPLTPLEAWYVLKGYAVAPAAGFTTEQLFKLNGRLEGGGKGPGGFLVQKG